MPGMWESPEIEEAQQTEQIAIAEAAPRHNHHGLHCLRACPGSNKKRISDEVLLCALFKSGPHAKSFED